MMGVLHWCRRATASQASQKMWRTSDSLKPTFNRWFICFTTWPAAQERRKVSLRLNMGHQLKLGNKHQPACLMFWLMQTNFSNIYNIYWFKCLGFCYQYKVAKVIFLCSHNNKPLTLKTGNAMCSFTTQQYLLLLSYSHQNVSRINVSICF